jgi:putative heme transporter
MAGMDRTAGRWAGPVKKAGKSAIRTLLIVAIFVGAGAAVYAERSTIGHGIHNVGSLRWGWVAAASLAEMVSMLAMALLYQTLLRASQARLTVIWVFASSYIANAISMSVPVIGAGMASRQAYQQFRQGGADPAAASLALTLAGVVSTVTFAPIVTAAALLSGNPAASVGGLLIAIVMVAGTLAVAVEMRSERGRARLLRFITVTLRGMQRITRHPRGVAGVLAQTVLTSIQRMRLGGSTLALAVLWGLVNWLADTACLAFALQAAGITSLSVSKILLVWTAGAGAASLSPTPAGIGAVEVAMVAALAAAGVKGSHAVTAVLVYRAMTLKFGVTLWALIYHYLHGRRQRIRPGREEPAAERVDLRSTRDGRTQ